MLILKKAISPIMLLVLLLTVLPLLSDLQSQYPAASSALQDGSNLSTTAQELDPAAKAKVMQAYGNLPLLFIANNGQVDSSVLYYAHVSGGNVYLTSGSIILDLARKEANSAPDVVAMEGQEQAADYQRLALRLNFEGANTNPEVIATEQTDSSVNYLIGNDQSKWLTDIPTYKEVIYSNVYPNIDLRLYGKEDVLTYDFIVHPGGNVDDIRLALEGIESLELSGRDLVLSTAFGELKQQRLSIYQGEEACRKEIEGNFKLLSETGYGFAVAAYDKTADLVIDPALYYSTYLGGTGMEQAIDIAIDTSGNAYVTGYTQSADFPTTTGAWDTGHNGSTDVFVTKLNAAGTALVYSTFIGSTSIEEAYTIAVDTSGNAYIAGTTESASYPTTPGAFDTSYNGGSWDIFVTKLSADGTSLTYSTFIGGNGTDVAYGITVNAGGEAYITGNVHETSGFPTTGGAYDTSWNGLDDAFVAKLSADGSTLIYSTFLGGTNNDEGRGIAIDTSGNAYVTGFTYSSSFPTTPGAYDTSHNGTVDVFVAKLSADGSTLTYSTFLGGTNDDKGYDIAIDTSGNAYVTGYTYSSGFPTTPGAYDTSYHLNADAFVTKLNAAGTALLYSTFLGGTNDDKGCGIAIDTSGNAYVTGFTYSSGFPTTPEAYDTSYNGGSWDIFVTKLNAAGTALLYSTFLGGTNDEIGYYGIAVDPSSCAYVAGYTTSTDFPTSAGAYDITYNGGIDAYIAKLSTAGIHVSPTSGLVTTEAGGTASFNVVLILQPTADVTININSSDLSEGTVAPASLTFTNANWNTPQTVTATGVDDVIIDGNVAYTIVTAAATSTDLNYNGINPLDVAATNNDNDTAGITVNPTAGLVTTEAGGTAIFTVVLNTQPSADVTIGLSSNDLSEGTVAPASLTFTNANWNTPQTVTVTGVDDPAIDGNVAYQIITAAATSTDLNYNGINPSDVSVTNNDNDAATGTVATATVTGTATFTTSNGSITGLTAAANTPCGAPPSLNFPHGFFSYNINGVPAGSAVTITITLPSAMPVGTQYWKCINGQWVNVTSLLGDNDGDNILTLTITDGSQFDADGVANGTIVDPGGPAVQGATMPAPAAPRASPTPLRQLNPTQISVRYLSVNPQQTSAGQTVTITTNVVNTGDEAGNCNVALKINGQVEQIRMVSVGPQGTQPVKFTIAKAQPGTYTIDIQGQSGSFTVRAASSGTGSHLNGGLIAFLMMGVLILVTVMVLLISRRPA